MQILDIVLYGDGGKVRRLELEAGKLNIITGASKTGKSALSSIVEYCLGRDTFLVPAGVITNAVRWYGLRLQFDATQAFVARQAPADGEKTSSAVFLAVASEVTIPSGDDLQRNTTSRDMRDKLTRMLHVSPNLNVPDDGESRRPLEASISQALLLCFQQQGEVAARDLLFHRQGESFVAQAVKDTLPYFLGAVIEGHLARVQELRRSRRDLAYVEKKLREAAQLRGDGIDKGLALLAEAEEAGLMEPGALPQNADSLRQALQPVMNWQPAAWIGVPGDATARLQDERSGLLNDYRRLRDRIKAAKSCADAQIRFEFEAIEQHARLQSVGVYNSHSAETAVCPICQSVLETPTPAASDLQAALERVSRQLNDVGAESPRLSEQIDQMDAELRDIGRRLDANRLATVALEAQQPEAGELMRANARVAQIVGRIGYYLENLPGTEQSSDLDEAVEKARRRVQDLQEEIDNSNAEDLLPSILSNVCKRLETHAAQLDLEYSDSRFRFDMTNLAIVADTDDGPVPMMRMGSAANWLGYHLATHMAFHEWFIQKDRPVPRFLFLDQPSQAYYPQDKGMDELSEEDKEGSLSFLSDEDRVAVTSLFRWLHDSVAAVMPNLQVIVTDHADIQTEWFQKSVIARWREGVKLIPMDWLP